MFPFSRGDQPAKNVIKLFPNESSSIDEKIIQTQESSADNISKRFLHLCVFVKHSESENERGEYSCDRATDPPVRDE